MNLRPYLYFLALGLSSLSGHAAVRADSLPEEVIPDPTPAHFKVCFNHGCLDRVDVRPPLEQWQKIRGLFHPPPASARAERARIAQAVGELEQLTGRMTGLDKDRGGSLSGLWLRDQMDCIDESTNTQTYLVLLHRDGLLRHHTPDAAARRFRPYLYQHYSATIRERGSGRVYAVDSWFHDHGHPAVVLPIELWKQGWQPGDAVPADAAD
jgi:hypothetical protein